MDEKTKRQMIRNYFKKSSAWPVVLIIIGVLVLLSGLSPEGGGGGAIVFGLILGGVGVLGLRTYGRNNATNQQMDEWLDEDLRMLTTKALTKMHTDESELVSESVSVTGPRVWDVGGAAVLFKRGTDNNLRFTPVGVSVICFTQNQLLAYNCVLDLTTGNALNESTDEYFYRDVVSVATRTDSKTVQAPKLGGMIQMNSAESFILTTSGGTSMQVLLRDPALIKKMGGGEIPTTRAEKAIQAVRKMLREKKSGVG